MDEGSANAYYDAQRTKGLGAAKFKRGLGYKPPECIPKSFSKALCMNYRESKTSQSMPPAPLPTPYMMPGARPAALPYSAAYPASYFPRPGHHPGGFPVMPAASPQLPSNPLAASAWTAHRSGDAVYYYNTVTGVSQWERPLEFVGTAVAPDATPKPIASERIQNTKWTEVKCEDGRVYYYNPETKATSWNVPDEVLTVRYPALSATVRPGGAPSIVVKKPEVMPQIKKGKRATPDEIDAFRSLLQESEVTAYARYEMEAAKLEDDLRWQGVSLEKERRLLFAEHCSQCARQERKIKRAVTGKPNTTNPIQTTDPNEDIDAVEVIQDTKEEEAVEVSMVHYPEESILKKPKRNHPSDFSSDTDRRKGSKEEKQKRAREEQEVINSRHRLRRATREAAISDFRTLLSELVKQPNLSWESAQERLEADIQVQPTLPLTKPLDGDRDEGCIP